MMIIIIIIIIIIIKIIIIIIQGAHVRHGFQWGPAFNKLQM